MFQRHLAVCQISGTAAKMQNHARTRIGVCHKSGTALARSVRKAFLVPAKVSRPPARLFALEILSLADFSAPKR